jgi:hypothetical protein
VKRGWDNPGGVWHWYNGADAACGSDVPLSDARKRRIEFPPPGSGKKCKRCVAKKGKPNLQVVR